MNFKLKFIFKIKTKKTIKLSIICDNNYVVNNYIISEPKKHDSKFVLPLIKNKKIPLKKFPYLVKDKGYISKKNKRKLKKMGLTLITPLRKNQKNTKQINKKNKKIKIIFRLFILFSIHKTWNQYGSLWHFTKRFSTTSSNILNNSCIS